MSGALEKYYLCPSCGAESESSEVARFSAFGAGGRPYKQCPHCTEDLDKSNVKYRQVTCVIDVPKGVV